MSRLTIKLCLTESDFPMAYKKWKGKEALTKRLVFELQAPNESLGQATGVTGEET